MLGCYAQSEPNVTVLTLPEGTTAGAARAAASHHADADFIGFLDLPDRIAPAAVGLIDAVIALDPQAELIFGDEDVLDRPGQRSDPFFKPGWDPELHSAGDLLGPLLIVRRDVLNRIQPWPEVESLRLLGQRAVTACRTDRIRHIPAVLCHRAAPEPIAARWTSQRHAVPRPAPLVSLIVPTKNRADLLRTCVDGVLNGTDYSDIELLILDNGTEEPEAVGLLHELASHDRVRVLALPGPFNWSALNNAGARAARGDILVLMNNDIAILQPDWLDEMVAQAARPEIGAVGAKLLYPDGALEHAGIVIVADGVPQHLFRRAPADTTFLNGTLKAVRSVSVVTGACLAVRRRSFFEVGGLDEGLAVSCNDVDLCLRLLAHGYRNVWTPFAVLEHREMASRGPDRTPAMRARTAAELDRLSGTWGSAAVSDGYFNPNLELVGEQPQLRCRGG
jgi:GT2 family glycosyltransferase